MSAQKGAVNLNSVEASTFSNLMTGNAYQLVLASMQSEPTTCWSCAWGSLDSTDAAQADQGDANAITSLEQRLRDDATYVPLWRANTVVASRNAAVQGVQANGYVAGVAWNAASWWRP
jgi:hypothetical protein